MSGRRPSSLALLLAIPAMILVAIAMRGRTMPLSTLERIHRDGVVRIGYANEAPFAFQDPASGKVTGEAPEIAAVLFRRLGVERIEPVLCDFGSLIPALQSGRFDIIAAGMYITPERAKQVRFTRPTYALGEGFLVRSGNPLHLDSFAAVATSAQARLGVVSGAIEASYARACGVPDDRIVSFPDYPSALAGLRADRIDALAGTSLTVARLLTTSGAADIARADPFTDPTIGGKPVRGYGAFAVRPEDGALADALDGELASFIGSPAHRALVDPFGFTAAELPGPATVADIVGR